MRAAKGNDLTPLAPDYLVCGYASRTGIDMHLSSLESLLIALEQRTLDPDQLDRFARLLQYGERTVMGRVKVRQRHLGERAALRASGVGNND